MIVLGVSTPLSPRVATVQVLRDPRTRQTLDIAMLIYFKSSERDAHPRKQPEVSSMVSVNILVCLDEDEHLFRTRMISVRCQASL